jgi:uroporphyrinogen decarboxylase
MVEPMTSRQRVLAALNHQPVDRVPIDLGGTQNSTMCTIAHRNLVEFLGVDPKSQEIGKAFEIVKVDEAVLSQLPVDTRSVFARPPLKSRTRWLDVRSYVDDWGVTYHRPENWPQYDMVAHPLAEVTIEDLDRYHWPDVEDEGRYTGLREEARHLHQDTSFAVCASTMDSTIFDRAWMLRGMEQFLVDILLDPGFALALMEKVTEIQLRRHEIFLNHVGPYIDVIMISDDMGYRVHEVLC